MMEWQIYMEQLTRINAHFGGRFLYDEYTRFEIPT